MNPIVLGCIVRIVALVIVPTLIMIGVFQLFNWLQDKFKVMRTDAFLWISTIATLSALFFSMYLMFVLAKNARKFIDFVYDRDQRRGINHAPSEDDLWRGIETLDSTRRHIRDLEEERKQILQDLFKLFPSVSHTSQGIQAQKPGDCTICLGEFVEGERCWVIPSCKHLFHSSCIDRWLMTRFSCPVCRNSLLPV